MTWAEWVRVNAALLPHQLAGAALLCVSVWLLVFHARTTSTRHFAGFLLGYGAAIVLSSIKLGSDATETMLRATASVAFFYCAAALLLCVLSFPRPVFVGLASKGASLIPAGVGVLAATAFIINDNPAEAYSYAAAIGNAVIACSVAIVFGRLARGPPGEERRSLLLLALGVSLQETYFTTLSVALIARGVSPYPLGALILWGNLAAILIILAGAGFLVPKLVAKDKNAALTARVALVSVPIGAATGIISALLVASPWVANLGALWRIAFVGLVAWGILRHQFLGIDMHVRWTLSRGTVAAAFVAAFFIATEGAQIMFGRGNEWVGLFAAGALVFAIAPLQRAAERLAEKAVPSSHHPDVSGRGREERYRAAVRLVIADRNISRDEERVLTLLALDLGIAADTAFAILDDETKRSLRGVTYAEAQR